MYRLSPTLLDTYRLYRDEDWKPYEELVSAIKRTVAETPQMQLGKAFHRVMEHHPNCQEEGGLICVDGYCFAKSIQPEEDKSINTEIKALPVMQTNKGDCTISMVADGIVGNTIIEYKTTQDSIDAIRYQDYYQWRCYLWGFSAETVIYDIMQLTEREDFWGVGKRDCDDWQRENNDSVWQAKDRQRVKFYPYERMTEDIRLLAEDMIRFCQRQGLEEAIKEA